MMMAAMLFVMMFPVIVTMFPMPRRHKTVMARTFVDIDYLRLPLDIPDFAIARRRIVEFILPKNHFPAAVPLQADLAIACLPAPAHCDMLGIFPAKPGIVPRLRRLRRSQQPNPRHSGK